MPGVQDSYKQQGAELQDDTPTATTGGNLCHILNKDIALTPLPSLLPPEPFSNHINKGSVSIQDFSKLLCCLYSQLAWWHFATVLGFLR